MEKILAVHNHEFDALMEMQSRSNAALAATQSANVPPQVTTPPPILAPQAPPRR
jgi:hypothetical protein